MQDIDQLLAECKGLLKETTITKPRYVPGVPQITGSVGYITQIRSELWPPVDVNDNNYQNDYISTGVQSCATNPDLEALLSKYASKPNVPTSRIKNESDIAFEAAFLDKTRPGKGIASFQSQYRSPTTSRNSSPRGSASKSNAKNVDHFARAFGSGAVQPVCPDQADENLPQRIVLHESVRVRLTGVSTRSPGCFLTAFRAVKIKSEQSTVNLHDQKSLSKPKPYHSLQASLAHGRKYRNPERDLPDGSVSIEQEFLRAMREHCENRKRATASSGERKSILKSHSRGNSLRKCSKSPPQDSARLGLDQSFVSNSEGLCHTLLVQSKGLPREGSPDKSVRTKSNSRSNSAKRAPWRPNSVVAPIPTRPEPVKYTPPTVFLKPQHPLYETVSNLKQDSSQKKTLPGHTTQKKRGMIRGATQNAALVQPQVPDQSNLRSTAASKSRRSRLYESKSTHKSVHQTRESAFEASSLSLNEEEPVRQGLKTSKSSRVVTFGNSICDGTAVKPKQVVSEEKFRSSSVNMQAHQESAKTAKKSSTAKVQETKVQKEESKSRRSNIQRSTLLASTGSGGQSATGSRLCSGSKGKSAKELHSLTFGQTQTGATVSVCGGSTVGGQSPGQPQSEHVHGPGQTGCSICVYNFGKNMPYETKHLGQLYAARRDEYQKQVLSNPELSLLSAEGSRSKSRSRDRANRSGSKHQLLGRQSRDTAGSGSSAGDQPLRFEGTGSSSLERARRLKKELNKAVEQQRQDRRREEEIRTVEDDGAFESLGIGGKVRVQAMLERYSTRAAGSVGTEDGELDETPRDSATLSRAEPARREPWTAAAGRQKSGQRQSAGATESGAEKGILVKENGERYEFYFRKLPK